MIALRQHGHMPEFVTHVPSSADRINKPEQQVTRREKILKAPREKQQRARGKHEAEQEVIEMARK